MNNKLINLINKNYPYFYNNNKNKLVQLDYNKNMISYLFEDGKSNIVFSYIDEVFRVYANLEDIDNLKFFYSTDVPVSLTNKFNNEFSGFLFSYEKLFYKSSTRDIQSKFELIINSDVIDKINLIILEAYTVIEFSFFDNVYHKPISINEMTPLDIIENLYTIFMSIVFEKLNASVLEEIIKNKLNNEDNDITKIEQIYSDAEVMSLVRILEF